MKCYRYSGLVPGEVCFMTCYQHPGMSAAARCAQCGKEICAACATNVGDRVVCRDCAVTLRSQPAPVAEEPEPEAQAAPESPVQAADSAPVIAERPAAPPEPPVGEPSGVPAPVAPSAVASVARPVPPATMVIDPGAGGRREKESLLSALLSLILPGAGQMYNGQLAKGIVLAAVYLGSIVIIVGGMILTALAAASYGVSGSVCCCCLPLFIVPMIVLIYAIYDAYNTAEQINSSQPAWKQP